MEGEWLKDVTGPHGEALVAGEYALQCEVLCDVIDDHLLCFLLHLSIYLYIFIYIYIVKLLNLHSFYSYNLLNPHWYKG